MDDSFSSFTSESSNTTEDEEYVPRSISKCFSNGSFSDVCGIKVLNDKEVYQKWFSIYEIMRLILPISTKTLFELLKKYKWDIDYIQKEIYLSTPDEFIDQENINIEEAFSQSNLKKNSYESECNICLCEDYLYKLSCNHEYCLSCWRNYVTTRISDNNDLYFTCVETNCKLIIDHSDIEDLLNVDNVGQNLTEVRNTLIRCIARKYADEANYIVECPKASCKYFISYEKNIVTGIECCCGGLYCKDCINDFHYPLKCGMIGNFTSYHIESNKDELETIKFLINLTRPCPNCKSDIEKFDGCNHMTCKKCQYEFCWQCLGLWAGYNVNHDCDITKSKIYQERYSKLHAVEKKEFLTEKYQKYFAKYNDNKVNMNFDENLDVVLKKIIQTFELMNEDNNLEKNLNKLHRLLIFHRKLAMNMAIFLFFCEDPSLNLTLLECRISISESVASSVSKFISYELIQLDKNIVKGEIANKTIGLFRAISIIFDECENCFNNNNVKFLCE